MYHKPAVHLFSLIILLAILSVNFGMSSASNIVNDIIDGSSSIPEKNFYNQPTDQLIIKYKNSTQTETQFQADSINQMQRINTVAGVEITYFRHMSGDAEVLRLAEKQPLAEVQKIADRLMTLPEVEYAEPDAIMFRTMSPNDSYYSYQWDYEDLYVNDNYGINIEEAWDITTGSPSIYIAVIDTGITNHSEFSGRTVSGYDFISNTFVANDGNGRDNDPSDPGDWILANECYTGSPARNSSWHGTHTSGTIGASGNNSKGIAGINWNSKIFMARVLGKCGGLTSDIADAMRWSAGLSVSGVPTNPHPAKVINMSLGGLGSCPTTYQNAVDQILASGAMLVVSAGNETDDASKYNPANCVGTLTVAATDRYGDITPYSNFGPVDISAPGGDMSSAKSDGILSTFNAGTTVPGAEAYTYYQGTSMAAPHLTGVVSLMYSINPSLTPAQVWNILANSVTPFPSLSNCDIYGVCGVGILNAGAAVSAVPVMKVDTTTRITSDAPDPSSVGQAVNLTYSVTPSQGNDTVTGNVTVSDGDQSCTATVAAGQCSITFNSTGSKTLTATYSGSSNFNGSSSTGETHTVNAINQPPTPPSNPNPANGATNISGSTKLIWSGGVDPDNDPLTYMVYLGTTNPPTTPVTGTNCQSTLVTNGCQPSLALSANTTYYWKVGEDDGHGHQVDSLVWSFTTQPILQLPGSFSKTAPTNSQTISTSPTLSWGISNDAVTYEYCYDTTNNNNCDSQWTTGLTTTNVSLIGLTNDTTYYWQVRARNSAGAIEADNQIWWSFTASTDNCISTWQMAITVKDNNQINGILTIGQGVNATDSIDVCYGEAILPPVPPSGNFDTRLSLPGGMQESLIDFRAGSASTITWTLKFQPSSAGYPFTFSWDPSQLPGGTFVLKDMVTGTVVNVDMKANSSYTLTNTGLSSLQIVYSQCVNVSISVGQGWNMVSLPGIVSNMNLVSLFPDVMVPAYKYANGYQAVSGTTVLSVGTGYWMYFSAAHTYPMCVSPSSPKNVATNIGWNMVGPFEQPINTSVISSTPANIIGPQVYSYQNGYTTVTALQPGKGYWAYTTQSGILHLGGGSSVNLEREKISEVLNRYTPTIEFVTRLRSCIINWQATISVTDNGQNNGTLIIGQGSEATNGIDSCYGEVILPPLPPSGSFDSRLMLPSSALESKLDFRSSSEKHPVWILKFQPGINGYPFHFNWNPIDLPAGKFILKDNLGGVIANVDMKTQSSYTLSNTGITSLWIEYSPTSNQSYYLPNVSR